MSNALISFLVALGSGTWLFNYFQRTSGNNTRRSITAALISGLIIFFVLLIILALTL